MHDKDWIVRGHNNKGPVSQILKASPFDITLWRLCKITKVWDDPTASAAGTYIYSRGSADSPV